MQCSTNNVNKLSPDTACENINVQNALTNLKKLKKRIIDTKELIRLYDAAQSDIKKLQSEKKTLEAENEQTKFRLKETGNVDQLRQELQQVKKELREIRADNINVKKTNMENQISLGKKDKIIAEKQKEIDTMRREQEDIRNKSLQVDRLQNTLEAAQQELEEYRRGTVQSWNSPSFTNDEENKRLRDELDKLKLANNVMQTAKTELEKKLKRATAEKKKTKQQENVNEIKKEYKLRIEGLQRELTDSKKKEEQALNDRSSLRVSFAHQEQQLEELRALHEKQKTTVATLQTKHHQERQIVPARPTLETDDHQVSKLKKKLKTQKEKYNGLERKLIMIRQAMMQTVHPLLFLDDIPADMLPPVPTTIIPAIQTNTIAPISPKPKTKKIPQAAPIVRAPEPSPPSFMETGGALSDEDHEKSPPKKKRKAKRVEKPPVEAPPPVEVPAPVKKVAKKRKATTDLNEKTKVAKPLVPPFDVSMKSREKTKAYIERTFEGLLDTYHNLVGTEIIDFEIYSQTNRLCDFVWNHLLNYKKNSTEGNTLGVQSVAKGICDMIVKMIQSQSSESQWLLFTRTLISLQIQAPTDVDIFIQILEVLKQLIVTPNIEQDYIVALTGGISILSQIDQHNVSLFCDDKRGTAQSKKNADTRGEFIHMVKSLLCDLICRIDYRKTDDENQLLVLRLLYALIIPNPMLLLDDPLHKTCSCILNQYRVDLNLIIEQEQAGKHMKHIQENVNGILHAIGEHRDDQEDFIEPVVHELVSDLGKLTEIMHFTQYLYIRSFEMIVHYRRENWEWIHDDMFFRGLWTLFTLDQKEPIIDVIITVAGILGKMRNSKELIGRGTDQALLERLTIIISTDTSHNFSVKTQICAATSVVEMVYYGTPSFDKLLAVVQWYEQLMSKNPSSETLFPKSLKQFIMLCECIKD
jgi:hypothetical protein